MRHRPGRNQGEPSEIRSATEETMAQQPTYSTPTARLLHIVTSKQATGRPKDQLFLTTQAEMDTSRASRRFGDLTRIGHRGYVYVDDDRACARH
jgi:hypothetical protein